MSEFTDTLRLHDDSRLYQEADDLLCDAANHIDKVEQELKELSDKITECWCLSYPDSKRTPESDDKAALQRIFNLYQDLKDTRFNYRVLHKAYNLLDSKCRHPILNDSELVEVIKKSTKSQAELAKNLSKTKKITQQAVSRWIAKSKIPAKWHKQVREFYSAELDKK